MSNYKQTEVGLIPEDWEILTFGHIVQYIKGFPFKSKDYRKTGVRIIRVSDTTFDSIRKESGIYVDEEKAKEFKNWELQEYDLIFTTVGSKPPMYDSMVGKVIIVSKEFEGSFLNQNAVLIRAINKTKEKQILLLNHFRTKRYLQYIELIYRGNANQASITLKELFGFKIPLPKKDSEQTAIATALSDTDALITSLEKLIAKKRNIKQGAMQELLRPKEGWVVKKLGEIILSTQLGGNYQNTETVTNFPLIKMGNIQRGNISTNKIEYITNQHVNDFDKLYFGDLLFNTRNTLDLVGKVAIWRDEIPNAYFNSNLMRLRFKPSYVSSNFFMNSLFNTKNLTSKLRDIATGTTSVAAIYTRDLLQINFKLPSPDEQIRIAAILSDMDSQITALETKLSKYKQIKQGMMQNLLTGKIRLV